MVVHYRLQRFFKTAMPAIMALPLTTLVATAQPLDVVANNTRLTVTTHPGSELQLEARNVPLAQVLDSLARQINIPIHYSVLPKTLVTATCVGSTLKQLLGCLISEQANLVFRYSENSANTHDIAEVWLIGSTLTELPSQNKACAPAMASNGESATTQTGQNQESEKRADELLAMAQSKNPEDRATAIGALLAEGLKKTPAIKAALEAALADQNASVRAQAVSTLAHIDGNDATPMLQEALHDSDADVRLMAVDSITDNVSLLNQAINDSDETVRSLATAKLEELTQNSGPALK